MNRILFIQTLALADARKAYIMLRKTLQNKVNDYFILQSIVAKIIEDSKEYYPFLFNQKHLMKAYNETFRAEIRNLTS